MRYVGSMVADVHRVIMSGGYAINSSTGENILDMNASENLHITVPAIFASEYEKNLFFI